MKKNGWKVIPLLLALALAASFFGCSKKEKEDNMPTVGTKASVEQYTFDGISAPSTTAEPGGGNHEIFLRRQLHRQWKLLSGWISGSKPVAHRRFP